MEVTKNKRELLLEAYEALFSFVAQNRIKNSDIDLREVHTVLISTLATIPLMWTYTFFVSRFIDVEICTWVGLVCSLAHMLSPLMYLYTNSSYIVINTMLLAGTVFTVCHAYYTGGIASSSLIWIMACPMLAGMTAGKKGATLWALIDFITIICFFVIHMTGNTHENLLSPEGKALMGYFIIFGWLGLASVLSFIFVILRDKAEKNLHEQTQKVDSLFRILFHDLSNSLGRINIGHTIAKRDQLGTNAQRGLEIAGQAADSMFEITQNVRKMYAVSKGKADMDLVLHPLNDSLEYVMKIFSEDLEKKKIKICWDQRKLEGLKLLVEPVSFKNQVLANIISNAIKFSPLDSKIDVMAYPSSSNLFTIEIKDNGIGMPPIILGQLFDLNKKTSRPGTCGEFGTGFGMHIMKSFVEIYQGQVKVESFENGSSMPSGTTFKLTLRGEWA